MERMTPNMLVQLKDENLINQHGEDPCRILEVKTKREAWGVVPVKLVLTSMAGKKFEATPHQISPY